MPIAKYLPQKRRDYFRLMALLIGLLSLFDLLTFLAAEGLWFGEVDYLAIFTTRLLTQGIVGLLVFGISAAFLLGNLAIAQRQSWSSSLPEANRPALPGTMGIARLLPLVMLLSLATGIILLYHGQVAVNHWDPNLSITNTTATQPLRFRLQEVWPLVRSWGTLFWQPIALIGLVAALLLYSQFVLAAIAVLMSLGFGLVLSEHWMQILFALYPTAFHQTDPLFGRDIGFYIFTLPLLELLEFWLVGLSVLGIISASLVYLLSGDSLSQGNFPGFSADQQRHLFGLGSLLMMVVALSYWLDRYTLLYSSDGAAYGASYTSVKAALPAYTVLSILALLLAGFLSWEVVFQFRHSRKAHGRRTDNGKPIRQPAKRRDRTLSSRVRLGQMLHGIGLYVILAISIGWLLPLTMQRLVVQPNELQLEQPYLKRTIALTRNAFALDVVNVETFDPENNLTYTDLLTNDLTVENIRIWDTRPLLETNRQLQRIRLYYEFPDADIDRYTIDNGNGGTMLQQVLIAARELDYSSVPSAAKTWINQHLIYTHGYGFTVSPVNVAAEGGLPDYYVQGIASVAEDPRVRDSIPVGKPRIYYGELTDTYVMTQTHVNELDYPSGSDNVYNTYDGWGGISIGSFWRRLLFAKHLRDWRMLLSDDLTHQTKLLMRRTITERVRAIAPFLRYDSDPYLVAVNTGGKAWERSSPSGQAARSSVAQTPDESYLYWIIDAYTTSDHYPYSDPLQNDFNYIRNSVKVVIDAYHGSVNFYVADAQDPIIQTWGRIFPETFQPLSQMPAALLKHIRYPQDYYRVQSDQLMTYHMTDPVVFYNREDQWRAPNEIYGNKQQLVEPYYLIMKLPTGSREEFILLRPFTPSQRNNLIAWLSARSDNSQYGKMLLYTFPKQRLIYGPEQIEARINQDPIISQQISLWNRQGSRAIQGNLLVIPIEQSLLYVEPLYLEAEQNQLPILARVIVVYGNRITMAETLEAALNAIFQPKPTNTPIVRPVEEGLPSN
jgi:uncharacterized membrane protein (UPF0182 family)